jgi:NDP-sugar pyrophosphorylase family protein
MKAFILGAGLGTRLKSLGLDCPKVMVPIGGKPLLQHHFELFREHGIRDFVVNLHYMPDKIRDHFGDGSALGIHITYSFEPELVGTAGAVKKMEHLLRDGPFVVFYGDNLVSFALPELLDFHHASRALATVALFESPEPWTGGVVETQADGRILRFVEKPPREEVTSNLINAGIYVLEPAVLDAIPAGEFYDFGKDLFPKLLARGQPLYAMKPRAYIQDVGTPERLAKAQRDFDNGLILR